MQYFVYKSGLYETLPHQTLSQNEVIYLIHTRTEIMLLVPIAMFAEKF